MSSPKNETRSIYIDHTSAEQALIKLEKRMLDLKAALDSGELAGDKLNKTLAAIDKTKKDILNVKQQISSGLTPTIAQCRAEVKRLENELTRMSNNAPGYADKFKSFQAAKAQLDGMERKIKDVGKAQSSWMNEAKVIAFGTLFGTIISNMLMSLTQLFAGFVSGNAKLSDSIANIEKATGLSTEEVQALNSQLGKINTRTATSDLREIAVGLGQIGEEADKGAIEAIDQIVVALGDEFGGDARGITTELSVLRNNLSDIKTGDYGTDIQHIGNALNVLGQEGLATAPVITEIAKRISGVAGTFGVSSGQIFGLAATFQELGIETERGSTAIIKIFQKIAAEPEKFAQVTKLTAAEFKQLVNTDMVAAFEAVAQGARAAGKDNVAFGKIIKELDTDGSGAGEVLSKLGTNAELLSGKIKTASEALTNNKSIVDEFEKKNNTFGASVDKLSKAWNGLIQSRAITEFLQQAVIGLTAFINALKAAPQYIKENQTGLYLLIAGIVLLNASYITAGATIIRDTTLKIINAATTRATAIASNLATTAQAAYIVVTNLLAGRITIATAAQRLWNTALALGAGPIGVIVIAVGALIMGFGNLIGVTKELTAAQQVQAKIDSDIAENTQLQEQKIRSLLAAAQDLTNDYDTRKQAVEELHRISNGYLQTIDAENISTQQSINLVEEYVNSLRRLQRAKTLASLKDDLTKEQIKQGIDLKVAKGKSDEQGSFVGSIKGIFGTSDFEAYTEMLNENVTTTKKLQVVNDEVNKQVAELNFQIEQQQILLNKATPNTPFFASLSRELANLKREKNILIGLPEDPADGTSTNTGGGGNSNFTFSNGNPKDDTQKLREEYLKLRADINDSINQLSQSSYSYNLSKIFSDKLTEEKRIFELFKAKIITAAERDQSLKDIQEQTELKVIKLNEDLQKNVKENPVTVDVIPEVQPEDIEALKFALKKALAQLAIPEREAAAKRAIALLEGTSKQKRDAALGNIDHAEGDELFQKQREAEVNGTNLLESEKEAIRAKYRQQRAEVESEFVSSEMENIKAVLGFAQQGIDILGKFTEAKRERENRELEKTLRNIETEKDRYRSLLDSRLISQRQYAQAITRLEAEAQAKSDAVKKKQFQRDKKYQLAQSAITGAGAIINAFNTKPFIPAGIAAGIAASALVGAQLITIATAKYAKGGFLKGDSHASGGMPVINRRTGKPEAEVEGGEVILSKATVKNNWDLISPLLNSSMYQGGRRINAWWNTRPYKAINYPLINQSFTNKQKFEKGGIFQGQNNSAGETKEVIISNDEETKILIKAILNRLDNPVSPVIKNVDVPLYKIQQAQQLQDEINNNSVFR